MANKFHSVGKYMQNIVDTILVHESVTKVLENGNKYIDLDFKETGYVKVMSILMDGLSDYYRANGGQTGEGYSSYPYGDGYKVGNVESTWEIFKLDYDRGKQFRVDDVDNDESAGLVVANLVKEFVSRHVVPEVDAVRFAKLSKYAKATLGNLKTGATIEANKVVAEFNTGFEWLFEHGVPQEDVVIFVKPSVYTSLINSTELSKFIAQSDYKNGEITFKVTTYNGSPLIQVPSSRFYTDVITGNGGFYPSSTAKAINYMMVSKKAVVPVVKVDKSKTFGPEVVQDFDGYKMNFRLHHDIIVPKNKAVGVYVSVSNIVATQNTAKLDVDVELQADGKYVVNDYFTTPAGQFGKLVHSASAIAVGSTSSATAIEKGVPFTKLGATEYYALLDADNKAIAVSTQITLPTAE